MIAYCDENTEKDNDPKKYIGGIVEVVTPTKDGWEYTCEIELSWEENLTEDIDYEILEPKQLPDADNNK